MTWDVFFDHLVTSNTTQWRIAQFAVTPWWPLILAFLFMVTVLSIWSSWKVGAFRDKHKWWRLCTQGNVISFSSWILLFITFILLLPAILLQFYLNIDSFWQLSPKGVTEVLDLLFWMGIVKIALLIVFSIWFFLSLWQVVITRRQSEGNKDKKTDSDYEYVLFFLADSSGEIDKAKFDNGTIIEPGEKQKIDPGVNLYFQMIEKQRLVRIDTHPSSEYDAKLICSHSQLELRVRDNADKEESSRIQLGKSFSILGAKFLIDSIKPREKTHSTSQTAAVIIGLVFLLLSAKFIPVHAWGERFDAKDNAKTCLGGTNLDITYAGNDSWRVTGTMIINSREKFDQNYQPQIAIDHQDDVIRIERKNWKRHGEKLFLKLVFDLDDATIYQANDTNPLSLAEPNAESVEKAFWLNLMTRILEPFHAKIAAGDIEKVVVSVSTLYPCSAGDSSQSLGMLGQIELDGSPISYVDVLPIEEAINCGYQPHSKESYQDITDNVWKGKIEGESDSNRAMIVIRWREEPLTSNSYKRIRPHDDSVPASQIVIIDIQRNHQIPISLADLNGHPVVYIVAPNKGNHSPNLPEKDIQEKMGQMVIAQAPAVSFSAVVKRPKLIDLGVISKEENISTQVQLVDRDDKVKCVSDDLPLNFVTTSSNIRRKLPQKLILFLIFLLTISVSFWTCMVVLLLFGSFIKKNWDNLEEKS